MEQPAAAVERDAGMGRQKGRHVSVAEAVAADAEMQGGVGVMIQHGRVFSGEAQQDGGGELGERAAPRRAGERAVSDSTGVGGRGLDSISFTVRGQGRTNRWIKQIRLRLDPANWS